MSRRRGLPTTNRFGEWVREQRMQRGLSQAALGDRVGYRQSHISAVESGHQPPSQELLEKLKQEIGPLPPTLEEALRVFPVPPVDPLHLRAVMDEALEDFRARIAADLADQRDTVREARPVYAPEAFADQLRPHLDAIRAKYGISELTLPFEDLPALYAQGPDAVAALIERRVCERAGCKCRQPPAE